MKIIVTTFVVFLLGTAFVSSDAAARCWWNGYNHCRYTSWHHGYGYYHHGYYHHGYWYR